MAVSKKKKLNLVFVFALLAALFFPQMALAVTPIGDPSNPTLTIQKFEQEPDTGAGLEGTGMPVEIIGKKVQGVTYEITQTHSFNPEDNEWSEFNGDTIEGTTGADGIVVFSNLELGRYEIVEVSGPDHILLNKEPFYVDIPMTNKEGTTLNYDVHVYPKNETIRSNVELNKVGEDENPLDGVSFKLYKFGGTPATDLEGNEIPTLVTKDGGKINVSGLAAGKYYFQETGVPAKYALNNTEIEFEIKKTSETRDGITVEWTPEPGFVNDGVVTNYYSPEIKKDANGQQHLRINRDTEFDYNLTIKIPGDIGKYKKFVVTDNLDPRLAYTGTWDVSEGASKEDFKFTQDGQLLTWAVEDFEGLSGNEEIIITFKAKILPDAVIDKEKEEGIENTAKLNFDNDNGWIKEVDSGEPPIVTPNDGGMQVIKMDATDNTKLLPGAEFQLTDKEGNVIDVSDTSVRYNGNPIGQLKNLVTDEDGQFKITGLTPGTYYLEETKAPTYKNDKEETKSYRLLAQPVKVTILHGEPTKVEVKNSKSDWLLPTTGGIGTVLFTSGGLSLMLAAMVLYARRRKSESNAA
ncbi:Fimbrial subunit type 1 precursor [Bhargavaea cecembensis DSE10]|uniref:Fimbrial subunit type 1 n=1 Tax=Bhargavaea cecembensis DSE10 TaxID=1235279 RepID=M7NXV6_9BACL|nr:SpaH/EbpB family LPXTG-anchored major pilin [Bhargavaea cecembensis]EMR06505.1 Fimbrial subunit type 1 precursor [Bhargavaea cecembensis DSE10]